MWLSLSSDEYRKMSSKSWWCGYTVMTRVGCDVSLLADMAHACAAVETESCGGKSYGDDVVFLVNDWMVGLVPLIMTSHYRRYNCYANARTIFDIHNMGYCG